MSRSPPSDVREAWGYAVPSAVREAVEKAQAFAYDGKTYTPRDVRALAADPKNKRDELAEYKKNWVTFEGKFAALARLSLIHI